MKVKVETIDISGSRTITEEEYVKEENNEYEKAQQIMQKQQRLAELTKDFAQVEAGLVINNLEERKAEFRSLLNEIRILQGKQPREININNQ